MHELALSSAIVATVETHARGRPVKTVAVRVGRLRQVVPESLEFTFGLVARDTVCDGARLDLEIVPAALRCATCGHEWQLEEPPFRCPECAGGDVTVVAGEELEVAWIEVEEEEEACIAPT